jgi:hypothetical protein
VVVGGFAGAAVVGGIAVGVRRVITGAFVAIRAPLLAAIAPEDVGCVAVGTVVGDALAVFAMPVVFAVLTELGPLAVLAVLVVLAVLTTASPAVAAAIGLILATVSAGLPVSW